MNRQSDKPPRHSGGSGDKKPEALLDDLDDIRELLTDEEVPLLDDVVAGGVGLDEAPLEHRGRIDEPESEMGLTESLFNALLSDDWRKSAATEDAAPGVPAASAGPLAQEPPRDKLKRELKQAARRWLDEILTMHRSELEARIDAVIDAHVDARAAQPEQTTDKI